MNPNRTYEENMAALKKVLTLNILSMQPLQSQVMQRIRLQICIITQHLIIQTECRRCHRR